VVVLTACCREIQIHTGSKFVHPDCKQILLRVASYVGLPILSKLVNLTGNITMHIANKKLLDKPFYLFCSLSMKVLFWVDVTL